MDSPVKLRQRQNWDAISAGWESAMTVFERGARPVTDRLLDWGGVRPGQHVLDLGTGVGEPAATAARAVSPGGRVVAMDISPAMLEAARRHAGGLDNVEFTLGDMEDIPLPAGSLDVVLSRWGLMFSEDPDAAFRSVARVLRPGGVLAAAVWSTPDRVPMMSLGYRVLSERLELPAPPPGTPGPYTLSDPDQLARRLSAAGFHDVRVEEFVVPFRPASAAEYVGFTRATIPPLLRERIAERCGSADDPETWAAVGAAAERHADGAGLSLPSTALTVRAVAGPALAR
ncbi:class I SAM-dependent methyltransferase [Micromonospora olivasterospora]|uniref:Ubiquinone/menaquinone biosynthesis C-methylase UbiE n=1 Tax=Micromonospora olivasterospora TaxID=1880 RepID=A0A562I2G5_MICOL|nr:methyltransferase domain-containing protein [Micromonospora olivasterospora]TWH65142.1 ubiquinone/menaquinone biosynthesis C-methylase UbiE [Micromonospora olivasterospora]